MALLRFMAADFGSGVGSGGPLRTAAGTCPLWLATSIDENFRNRMKNTSSDLQIAGQIRAYLAAQPPHARAVLKQIREAIRSVAPDAVDSFSYRIPGVKLEGKALVWYAGFRQHTSLYPIGDAIRGRHAAQLEGLETSKGTVRFPLDAPLPVTLVKSLVNARVDEIRSRR
jgi:uncharacterized protein YdhG (YjbR/CyaY superfamily)